MALARDKFGNPVQALEIGVTQKIAVGAASTTSTAISADVIRVKATVDCHIKVGVGATTNDLLLSAGETEYFSFGTGGTLAVIRAGTTDGSLFITAMS
jgi:hypothetical protein